jgi:hypothetical protein
LWISGILITLFDASNVVLYDVVVVLPEFPITFLYFVLLQLQSSRFSLLQFIRFLLSPAYYTLSCDPPLDNTNKPPTDNPLSKSQNLPLPSSKEHFNGDLTYYSPGPGYGACGYENTSQDSICALSHLLWDSVSTSTNPNHNPLCGKKLRITRFDEKQGRNNSVDVTIVDRCTGCKATDVDLSLRMFEILADEEQGRVVSAVLVLQS